MVEPRVDPPPAFPPEDRRVGRRALLGMLGLGGLGILWGAKVQERMESALRPLTVRDDTGLSSLLPAAGRFRIYTVTGSLPSRSDAEYRLAVSAPGRPTATLDLADLREGLPQTELTRDFQCVTGWRVDDVAWQGVQLRDLLDVVGVQSPARAITFHSHDGLYTESLTLDQVEQDEVMVATHLDGEVVSRDHGGPVRLLVVPMYGYKSLKWLSRIELVDEVDPGYWEERGYDIDAYVGSSNGRSDEPIT